MYNIGIKKGKIVNEQDTYLQSRIGLRPLACAA